MWLSGAVVTLSFVAQAISQTPATYFLNPPATGDNPIYTVGSQIDVQWITNMTSYNIFLWQQDLNVQAAAEGTQPIYTRLPGSNGAQAFTWTVTSQQFDLAQSDVFFLTIGPSGATDLTGATTSHFFNLTAAAVSTTSAGGTSATPSPSPTQPTTSPSTPTALTESSTKSSTNSVAVGLGVGLGIPFALLLAYVLLPRRYRRKITPGKKPPSYADSVDHDVPGSLSAQAGKDNQIKELPNRHTMHAGWGEHEAIQNDRPGNHRSIIELEGGPMYVQHT